MLIWSLITIDLTWKNKPLWFFPTETFPCRREQRRRANQFTQTVIATTQSTRSPTEWQLSGLNFPPRHSFRWQHLSSSYTAALHPACLSDCPRALKVSKANSTWALNYLINLGWQGRLKPLCDPQAPHTDISHWTRGCNPVRFFETLKCLTRFIPNPQLYLYRSLPDLYYYYFLFKSSLIGLLLNYHHVKCLAMVESRVKVGFRHITPNVGAKPG